MTPQLSSDICFLADTHYGLQEMKREEARGAQRSMLDALERRRPQEIVLNGDYFDLVGDIFHARSDYALRVQVGPVMDFLWQYRGRITHVIGNADPIRSLRDLHRYRRGHGFPTLERLLHRMHITPLLWRPEIGLLATHGHALRSLTRLVRERGASLLSDLPCDPSTLPQEEPKRSFFGSATYHAVDTMTSAASMLVKQSPAVRQKVQDVHVQDMRTLIAAWESQGMGMVRRAVFSHTHQYGEYRQGDAVILNTGTAGPQGPIPEATFLVLKNGDEPEKVVTYSAKD